MSQPTYDPQSNLEALTAYVLDIGSKFTQQIGLRNIFHGGFRVGHRMLQASNKIIGRLASHGQGLISNFCAKPVFPDLVAEGLAVYTED